MPIVMKFGGTSVADAQRVKNAACIAAHEAENGKKVVVVVSAQGDYTDELIEKAQEIISIPPPRELDALLATGETASSALMAMALISLGHNAVSLTGAQAGIATHGEHSDARIYSIDTSRILRELGEGKIVVVAGFQGEDPHGNTATIGRGGSDTTATALACALNASECRIYTDVSGVYSADPRTVAGAVRHSCVGFDEMNALASMGASVLHGRSVSLAKIHGVPVTVLSALDPDSGTRLVMEPLDGGAVTAVTSDKSAAFVRVRGVSRVQSAAILHELASKGISSDMVSLGDGTMSFCAAQSKLYGIKSAIAAVGATDTEILEGAAKISAVGLSLGENPLVAAQMMTRFAREGIEPLALSTGDLRVSIIVEGRSAARAVELAHALFFENQN